MNWLKLLGLPVLAVGLATVVPNSAHAQITSAGDGTAISPNGSSTTDITGGTQAGSNLFHSFGQFNVDAGQTANFVDPGVQNILGRVIGGNASLINGVLQVTGGNANLYLMNPAGIIFGSGASLNVGGSFTATTANGIGFEGNWFNAIGSNDYTNLIGNPTSFAFTMAQPGAIVNAGNLGVGQGQSITLLGGTVINTGTLTAPEGKITVAAVPGEKLVSLSQDGSLLSLALPVETGTTVNALPFTPLSLPQLLVGGNLNNATGVTVEGDVVRLTGSGVAVPTEAGTAIVSSTVDASGATGGTVHILGDKVGLVDANIDASGTNGGGIVLVGGDYKGEGTVPNAQQTYVSADSVINVDALQNGDGGKVIVWADNATRFYGSISAHGGSQTGNGGFVEVSGKQNLTFDGTTDLSAPNGMLGSLLLDPINIRIVAGNSAADDNQLADGQILSTDSPTTSFTISKAALEAITGNVQLEATNDIAIDPGVSLSFSSNPPGSATSGGSITFTPNSDFRDGGSFSMSADATIQTNGRDIKIKPGENSSFKPGPTNIFVGNISTNGGNIDLDGPVVLAGNTTLNTTTATGDGGNISVDFLRGSINSDGATPRDLRLIAGSGSISIPEVGETSRLRDLIASGRSVSVLRASTTGTIELTAIDSLSSSELNARDLQLNVQQGSLTLDKNSFNATNQLSLNARDGLTIISSRLIADPVNPLSFVRLSSDNRVSILDRPASPTVIQSGRSIYVQGNQAIQVLATNNPGSLFQSVSSTTLASNSGIVADGNFTGGAFEATDLRGRPNNIASSNTLIRATGDVTFGDYQGLALKVESTGSIQGGNIRILAPNESLTGADPDIAILNSSPSLILRAGVTSLNGSSNVPANPVNATLFSTSATSSSPATITVGNIDTSVVVGKGGSVTLNAPGSITTGTIDTRSSDSNSDFTRYPFGGAVDIESNRQVATGNISTRGGEVRVAGSDLQLGIIDAYNRSFNVIGIRDLPQQGAVKLESTNGDIIVRSIRSGMGGIDINSVGQFVATDAAFQFRLGNIGVSSSGEQIELRSSPELINFFVNQGFNRAELEQSQAKITVANRQTTPTSVVAYSYGSTAPSNIRIRHSGRSGINNETLQIIGGGADIDFAIAPNTEPGLILSSFESLSNFNPSDPDARLRLERNDRFLPVQEFPSYYSGTAGAIFVGNDDNSQLYTITQPIPFLPQETAKETTGSTGSGGSINSNGGTTAGPILLPQETAKETIGSTGSGDSINSNGGTTAGPILLPQETAKETTGSTGNGGSINSNGGTTADPSNGQIPQAQKDRPSLSGQLNQPDQTICKPVSMTAVASTSGATRTSVSSTVSPEVSCATAISDTTADDTQILKLLDGGVR
ncbi:filamentous hemagglutinin N-terminal domain-containing protein [Trichocoleus sp. FACHB-262]|uniref:two-partner secretion domain-containing protein n=1 Tax=Trichocoleus sp. FACHB-262 TaxID=2692869 RepID=UPI001689984E|nr:filamentous hemagglutinin N-terminal domain-containing protein [Trichocoleus sp. FACHB-262]MBD2122370.1 filamentous hemagglutinin N-terminal domain-containing protein [Trichocoleus sp. FACHB-262]